ncbi:MAG: glycosyltransferase [Planctomycetes bacterium B3_Pla]|nr:MAG: glycosyltransferase [Planctomycetes bacterium B3_Pla]
MDAEGSLSKLMPNSENNHPRITWVTRSFLDYRVPVYEQLNSLINGRLTLLYYRDVVPDRVSKKVTNALGRNAVGMTGEIRFTGKKSQKEKMANTRLRLPYQPGLIKAIARSKPDVLVSDGFFQWTYAALWLRALKNIPHVMCYERNAHTERNAQWYRTAYRKFARRWIDAICCSGRLCGEYVQSLGFPVEKTTFGHMVADTAGLQNDAANMTDIRISELKARYDLKGTVFLYIGQLIPRKGLIELLNAWKVFTGSVSADEATLFVVGDGSQRQECESFCSSKSLRNVRFAGAIDYDELAPYYKAADVFVIPTLEDNWSLVVPEAMACGLPILCSKYNGCWPELVHSGENGWVFDPLDTEDTLRSLRAAMENKDSLRAMGERSRVIVGSHTAGHAAATILEACKIAVCRTTEEGHSL